MYRLIAVAVTFAASGCFEPSFDGLLCGTSGECPRGLFCRNGQCGTAAGGDDAAIDSGNLSVDARTVDSTPAACAPDTQVGCSPSQRCAYHIESIQNEDPLATIGQTICQPIGNDELDQPCSFDTLTGNDSCRKGLGCSGLTGFCRVICHQDGAACDGELTCVRPSGLFVDREGIGLCIADA
jgi:hypothetical protein